MSETYELGGLTLEESMVLNAYLEGYRAGSYMGSQTSEQPNNSKEGDTCTEEDDE